MIKVLVVDDSALARKLFGGVLATESDMEVMLKPLDGLLAGMRGVAGSTLLGDGSVLLVLDLGELFQ